MSEDDLRGSTPVYTAKDVLVRLDGRIENVAVQMTDIHTAMQVILSQNLHNRLSSLENERVRLETEGSKTAQAALALARNHQSYMDKVIGAGVLLKLIIGANALTAAGVLAALAKSFGLF